MKLANTAKTCRLRDNFSKICQRQARNYADLSTTPSNIFDVVCVGGGPAGLSLLAALRSIRATKNLKVALVDTVNLDKTRSLLSSSPFSNRVSSITPSSMRFLDQIGAWNLVQSDRVQAYHEMQVWDGVSDARIEFNWQPAEKIDNIAYMTENLNLTSALLTRIKELGGVEIFDNQKLIKIDYGMEAEQEDLRTWPVVHLQCGEKLVARLLVGADGANSHVRTFAGIGSRGWDYDRVGVVATLKLQGSGWNLNGCKTAYQRFLPTGPIAMLPLPGNYSTLVWSTTPERADCLKRLNSTDFIAMINAAFRLSPVDISYMHGLDSGQHEELVWRLQHTKVETRKIPQDVVEVQERSIASFPLKMRHADTYISERVALVGDAAHSIHPLAGLGLNQGQADVESLVKTIKNAVIHGEDIGVSMTLEPYNAERYAANHVLLGVVDKLHKLYSVESGPLVPLRSLGLRTVNSFKLLKQFFMEQAARTGTNLL
ncbi:Bgt-4737 [Blumeria graminis f. sp. tritici]|uniref:Ubiquinone biosynthesis monooxygenase COQ6, mitochondrial n=2 Tax=Blumeria graminis f. sp. tritici TaxID=62690 RepID=A0A381LGZ1_BLUGR|nr:flavin-dependent monooxygenase [Blumeria graminis f. sp. tritici 96224]VDB90943.1 Bgt-4737 [Blumeria graminis f. sp. tritici]